MRIVTIQVQVHTGPDDDNPLDKIDPRVVVEGEDGWAGEIVLGAAIGGLKSAARAVEAELEKYQEALSARAAMSLKEVAT